MGQVAVYLTDHVLPAGPHGTHDMATWQASGGFSIDASMRVEGDDRLLGFRCRMPKTGSEIP